LLRSVLAQPQVKKHGIPGYKKGRQDRPRDLGPTIADKAPGAWSE
jgi:hypothetical protein